MTDLNYIRTGYCSSCGACCRDLVLKVKYRISGDVAQYLTARGVEIKWGPRYTILNFPNYPCPKLSPDNTCSIYNDESLPRICIDSPNKKWHLHKNCNFKIEQVKE